MSLKYIAAVVAIAACALVACGDRKSAGDGQRKSGQKTPPTGPASKLVEKLLVDFGMQQPMPTRRQALDTLVAKWPETRAALPRFLGIARLDDENRASIAMGLSRLGMDLVKPVLDTVKAHPTEEKTLLTAGAVAYHLAHPSGLVRRPAAKIKQLRRALRPLLVPLLRFFQTKRAHDQAILMGVAAFGHHALKHLKRGPFEPGSLTRVALVLHLMMTGEKNQSIFSQQERASLRKEAAPLADVLVKALLAKPVTDAEEQPASLCAGLEVLGEATIRALIAEPRMRQSAHCAHAVDVLSNVPTHTGVGSARPAAGLLAHCTSRLANQQLAELGAAALGRLGPAGLKAARAELGLTVKALRANQAADRPNTWYTAYAKQPVAAALYRELAALYAASRRARNTTHRQGALDALRRLPPATLVKVRKEYPMIRVALGRSQSRP